MNSWMIGAMMTIPNSRGSPFSSISSFQTSNLTRRISGPLPAEPDRCQRQHDDGEHDERDQVAPERRQSGALQDHSAKRTEEIAGRHDARGNLQERRHARDGKN